MTSDRFLASEFDAWASRYDQGLHGAQFPFEGYARVLQTIADVVARSGLRVIGDIVFPASASRDALRRSASREAEDFWLADETLTPSLGPAGK